MPGDSQERFVGEHLLDGTARFDRLSGVVIALARILIGAEHPARNINHAAASP